MKWEYCPFSQRVDNSSQKTHSYGMKKSVKKPQDFSQLAASIVSQAVGESPKVEKPQKNPHAVALGRKGGLKGGPARSKALSDKRRKEIAKKAAKTRWPKN